MPDARSDPPPDQEDPHTLIGEIMRRDQEDRAASPARPARKARGRLGTIALLVVFAALVAWNVVLLRAPNDLAPRRVAASGRFTVYLAAHAIEAHRDSAGELPEALATVGADWQEVRYVRGDTGYRLHVVVDGGDVVYQSGEPLGPYAAALDELERR